MLKASQRQVYNSANVNLVQLRQLEVQYFSTFFNNFGIQVVFMLAILYTTISQLPVGTVAEPPSGCPPGWIYFYSAMVGISTGASFHVLLCGLFIVVYGQGLAIRGPKGSLVRAVEGMVIEQRQVVASFLICLASMILSTVANFFVMFDVILASISSVVILLYFYYSLQSIARIFNRFNFEKENEGMTFEVEADPFDGEVTLLRDPLASRVSPDPPAAASGPSIRPSSPRPPLVTNIRNCRVPEHG